MRSDEIDRAEWESPDNWWGGAFGVYVSRRDSRVWVPKRSPALGGTLNFGRPASWLWLAALLAIPALVLWAVF